MAAALPKRHLVAVTQKASEFRLLVFTLCWYGTRTIMHVCIMSTKSGLIKTLIVHAVFIAS